MKQQTNRQMESDESFNVCSKDLRESTLSVTHLTEKLSAVKESLGSELTAKGEKLAEKDAEIKRINQRVTDLNEEIRDLKNEIEEGSKKGKQGTGVSKVRSVRIPRNSAATTRSTSLLSPPPAFTVLQLHPYDA